VPEAITQPVGETATACRFCDAAIRIRLGDDMISGSGGRGLRASRR